MVLSKLPLSLWTFCRATKCKQLISTGAVCRYSSHTLRNFVVKQYSVTYLIVLVGSGCATMIGYGIYCMLYNPAINLPFWDKEPRYHSYARAEYTSKLPPTSDHRDIPVIMFADGSLDFVNGETAEPPTKEN